MDVILLDYMFFFFQAEDGIRYLVRSRGLGDVYKRQVPDVPSRGRFQPFMFKGTVFSTGGYSAEYGQALSSAVILNTEDMPEYTASGVSIAPIFLGAFHTQKFNKDKTALGGGINYTLSLIHI